MGAPYALSPASCVARKRHTCVASANNRFTIVWYTICSPAIVIRLTLSITAARGESSRLIEALQSLMVPTRRKQGCLSCQLVLSSESSDPARISYTEDWSSEDDLREQVRSERFSRLLELMDTRRRFRSCNFSCQAASEGSTTSRRCVPASTGRIRGDPASINPDES